MNKMNHFALALLAGLVLLSGCGKDDPVPELHLVPGTALLHVHIEPGINPGVTSFAGDHFSGFVLADSLLKSGSLGISIVGVDISTLEPQLLILSRNATIEYATALTARVLDLDPSQEEGRVDLMSEYGYARASVTGRDGWTAIYIGPAPHITLGNWLDLKKDESLAADTSLASVIPEDKHFTILFPGNLFGFVSLLPLERQIPWWTDYKDIAETVKPAALSLSLSWPEADTEESLQGRVILARRDGGVTSVELSVSDSRIDTDSCFTLLLQFAEGSLY